MYIEYHWTFKQEVTYKIYTRKTTPKMIYFKEISLYENFWRLFAKINKEFYSFKWNIQKHKSNYC